MEIDQSKVVDDRTTLALCEVPFTSGKIQLKIQWKSGTFLPIYERRLDDEFALENFTTPFLFKLELIKDEE